MSTGFGVDAFLGQPQAFHGLAANQMLFHNLRGVGGLDMAVPDCIRIDHQIRAVLSLIETAGLVGPDFAFEAAFRKSLLE